MRCKRVVCLSAVLAVMAGAGLATGGRLVSAVVASSGCQGTPITSVAQLEKIGASSALPLTGTYCLTADLDASGTASWNGHAGFTPIASNGYLQFTHGFRGTLDGQGHTIRNLTIANTKSYGTGLIAVLQGTVRNLHLVNARITGAYDTGGIAADNVGGTIETSTVSGSVSSTRANGDSAGGIAAYLDNGTLIDDVSTAQVSGPTRTWLGGLVGSDVGGVVHDSYSTGPVRGASGSLPAGFVGEQDGQVTGSFWDTGTSGRSKGVNRLFCQCATARGLSDGQMREKSSFAAAGWNFSSVWWISNGKTYPLLRARSGSPPIPGPSPTPTPTATPAPTPTPIPISMAFAGSVARGGTQTVDVTTVPHADVSMEVLYPQSGDFTVASAANAQGLWEYTWTVDATAPGTATLELTVDSGAAVRHYTKTFTIT